MREYYICTTGVTSGTGTAYTEERGRKANNGRQHTSQNFEIKPEPHLERG
jgi:hypothetical protein